MVKKRTKKMTSKARRLRKIAANKRKLDPLPPASAIKYLPVEDEKPKRVRWRKFNVTKQYTNNDQNSARAILTTTCILSLANTMLDHGKVCPDGHLTTIRIGSGKMQLDCAKCKQTFVISQDLGMENSPLEKALTLSVFASGTGLEAVNTILSTLQLPELSFYKFQRNEEIIYCELSDLKEKEFALNAQEEYRLAMENGDYVEVDGKKIPFITVVVDGGWSKRSYRHSFDSKSGVAVIIGARTKKVLWMDTRIKVCARCSRAKTEGREQQDNKGRCFKNWDKSAQAMEADIIVDGFRKSFLLHGLMYRYVVGDADSSVYFKIKETIFYPGGVEIQKVDCVNHALRCLNSKLHGIAKTSTFDKYQRDLVTARIPQMSRDAKGAINHNSELVNDNLPSTSLPPAKRLFNDITNIPLHVFGDHSRCDSYFCQKVGCVEYNPIRGSKFFSFVRTAFQQLAQRSDRLIHNVTSNLAEGFMAQVCKFTSGKRCNQSLSYGYPMRAMASVFAFNYGSFWPGAVYKRFYDVTNKAWKNKYAQTLAYRQRCKKPRKTKFVKSPVVPRKKVVDYGENASDYHVDIAFLKASVESQAAQLQVSAEKRLRIQSCTIGQAYNDEWRFERRHRVTASNAGKISMLYPKDLTRNENVRRGIDMEPFARKKYEEVTGNFVDDCGLFVSAENGVLAASPDGLIGEEGILELKCPSIRPKELCSRKDKIFVQDKDDPTKIKLNRNHSYYYQVIMQLYVAEKIFCDFVIYFLDKETGQDDIWIERIQRSSTTDSLWAEMKTKLIRFFYEDLAPEIVCPRFPQNLRIRQPLYRKEAALTRDKSKNDDTANKLKSRKRKRSEADDMQHFNV